MLPQYEILELLGRGGMGAVYKARQISLNRLVAIKILPATLADDPLNFADRFKQEAQMIAQLSHPAIIHIYDFGTTECGLLYFVMEYVDGKDVAAMLTTKGKLSVAQATSIADAVCQALHYAHSQGVIHRDIKPANVLISNEGQVKVADFGLAKMTDPAQASGLTRTNVAMGTQEFAAPEMLTPGATVDHRADLYSLGVMLYQMLTGEIPRVMFKLPSRCRPELGTRFDTLICRALETEPDERFQSAAEFRRELDATGVGSIPAKCPGMSRLLWSACAVVVVGMAIFALKNKSPAPTTKLGTSQSTAVPTPRRSDWIKLLDTPEVATRSGIKDLEWKDGWLTVTSERLYLVRLAGGKDKVRDMAFRAAVHPPTNEWPITAILRAGANPQYNLDIHNDRLTLKRVAQVASSKPVYTQLGNVPLDLRPSADRAFLLEASIQGNLITIMADGAKVIEVRDEGASGGAGDITLAAVSDAKGSGKIKDLAFRLLDESAVATEAHGGTIDLLALVDVKRDAIEGDWTQSVAGLTVKPISGHADKFGQARLQLPYLPPAEYDFEMEFTTTGGVNQVCQILSSHLREFSWSLNGGSGDGTRVCGFEGFDGKPTSKMTETSARMDRELETGRRYRSRVEVRQDGLRGFLDDKTLVDWKGDFKHLSDGGNSKLHDVFHLGLRSARDVIFHRVTVREVSGIGTVDQRDTKQESAPNAAANTGAVIDLLGLVDVKRDTVSGEWSRTADGLEVKQSRDAARGRARLQLPYTPSEEYDFDIEFTVGNGPGFIGQALSTAGHTLAWIVDQKVDIGTKAGFEMLHGKPLWDNSEVSVLRKQLVTNGQRHISHVEMRRGKVLGFLDGEKLVHWGEGSNDFKQFEITPDSVMRDARHLGIIASDRAVTFHKITVREVSGIGTVDKLAAVWTDWLGPKLKKPGSLPTGMVSAPDGVSTDKQLTGYEILPQGTSDAVVRVTYVIRDSAGVSVCQRGDGPGKNGESYLAQDNGNNLELSKVLPGGSYQKLLAKPVPEDWSHAQERTMEFSVVGDTLTATLNGTLIASIHDASLTSGHGTVLLSRNVLLKKVEYRVPGPPP